MYKKILAGQLDALKAELERERQQREALTGKAGRKIRAAGNIPEQEPKKRKLTGAGLEQEQNPAMWKCLIFPAGWD